MWDFKCNKIMTSGVSKKEVLKGPPYRKTRSKEWIHWREVCDQQGALKGTEGAVCFGGCS